MVKLEFEIDPEKMIIKFYISEEMMRGVVRANMKKDKPLTTEQITNNIVGVMAVATEKACEVINIDPRKLTPKLVVI